MNANGKPDDSAAAAASGPSPSDVGPCVRPAGPEAEAGNGPEPERRVAAPGAQWGAVPDEKVEPEHDAAALAREARLMRLMSLACYGPFLVAAILWLLATVLPPPDLPPRPAPALRPSSGALHARPGCVRSLKDNKLYGRAIVYDHDGRAVFRRVTPEQSLDAPPEWVSTAGAPLQRR
jgi:hypothetical protein